MTQQAMSRTGEIERRTTSGYVGLGVGIVLIAADEFFVLNVGVAGPSGAGDRSAAVHPRRIRAFRAVHAAAERGGGPAAVRRLQGHRQDEGLHWANPFYTKQKISLRARNLNSEKLKVNDKRGNPIEIAAVVVWRVDDTAQAMLRRRRLRELRAASRASRPAPPGQRYAYDDGEDDERRVTLRGERGRGRAGAEARAAGAASQAGVVVEEARLTHLAYAPEIAQAMLRRQQAEAIIAARQQDRRRRGQHGGDGAARAARAATSSTSTTSARPRWSATCWSSCAASPRRSRWSTPARCTPEP